MSGYRVVINSAGRALTLATKTLPMLRDGGVPMDRVTVSVPPGDINDYMETIFGFDGITLMENLHDPFDKRLEMVGVAPVGLGRARNNVLDAASPGERLLFVDDDLTGVFRATGPQTLEPITDIDGWLRRCWEEAEAAAVTLWGIYPVRNPYFMKNRANTKLTYICGGLFGVKVTGREYERVVLDDKEDFERSIRHYLADGRVLRFENVAIGTTGYSGAGGMQLSRTSERVMEACRYLVATYPGLCSLNLKKKSGWAEVRLADRRPKR